MYNLLKSEFYKLLRHKGFWGLLAFSLILGSIMLLDRDLPVNAADCFDSSLHNMPLLYFLVIIFGALFIGEDFSHRAFHSYIGAGHQRGHVLLAKTLSFLSAGAILLAAPMLLDCLICYMVTKEAGSLALLPFSGLLIPAAVCAMGMLPLMAAFLFKDVGKTLAVPMGLLFIMIFLLNGDTAHTLALFLPIGQLRLLSLHELSVPCGLLAAIDVVWIVLGYAGSYLAFYHSDLQ